jgi:type VI protein secretion system component Hcp
MRCGTPWALHSDGGHHHDNQKECAEFKENEKRGRERLGKLTVPKGEKVSSMKGSDFTITKVIDKASPN